MESARESRFPSFVLSLDQQGRLRSDKSLSLSLEPHRQTKVSLNDSKSLLTVFTTFEDQFEKTGPVLQELNEANKQTSIGAFIFMETMLVGLRTTTFYIVEEGELPQPQIEDIVKSHYTPEIDTRYSSIRASMLITH